MVQKIRIKLEFENGLTVSGVVEKSIADGLLKKESGEKADNVTPDELVSVTTPPSRLVSFDIHAA